MAIIAKRYNGSTWVTVGNDWSNIANKPSTFTAAAHSHGDIADGGTISATAVTPANGDYLLLSDSSNSNKIARGVAVGTGTTTFLRNDGTWSEVSNVIEEHLTSDATSTSTSYAATNLNITTPSTGTYRVRFIGTWTTDTATTGLKFGLSFSGTATTTGIIAGTITSSAAATELKMAYYTVSSSATTGNSLTLTGGTVVGMHTCEIDAIFHVTVSGDFIVRIASEVGATTVTLLAGSSLSIQKLASATAV